MDDNTVKSPCIDANATCNGSQHVANQEVLVFKSVLSDMKLLKYFG